MHSVITLSLCLQREASKVKDTLFASSKSAAGNAKLMRAEEHIFSATDVADLDDDPDDDVPLIELARKSLQQARSNEPWKAIRPEADAGDAAEDVDDLQQDVALLDQDKLMKVCDLLFLPVALIC